jgi:hypothetical protein
VLAAPGALLAGQRAAGKRRAAAHTGTTRLYTPIDVAFVRLALRLAREGVSTTVARVVMTYLRSDLIRAWKAGAPLALAVRDSRIA